MGKQQRRKEEEGLHSRPFGKLRGMRLGPPCLACGEAVQLERQGNRGHGWLHPQCEGTHLAARPRYYDRERKPIPEPGNRATIYAYATVDSDDVLLYAAEV